MLVYLRKKLQNLILFKIIVHKNELPQEIKDFPKKFNWIKTPKSSNKGYWCHQCHWIKMLKEKHYNNKIIKIIFNSANFALSSFVIAIFNKCFDERKKYIYWGRLTRKNSIIFLPYYCIMLSLQFCGLRSIGTIWEH